MKNTIGFKNGDKIVLREEMREDFMSGSFSAKHKEIEFISGVTSEMRDIMREKKYIIIKNLRESASFERVPLCDSEGHWTWDLRWFELDEIRENTVTRKLDGLIKEMKDLKALEELKISSVKSTRNPLEMKIDFETIKVNYRGNTGVANCNRDVDIYREDYGTMIATARACGLPKRKVEGIIDVLYEDTKLSKYSTTELLNELQSRNF